MLRITIDISDAEEACLKNDLLNINTWVMDAVKGKINQCRKRLIREWQPRLFADPAVTTIPGDEDGFITVVFAHPDYKDRATREAELSR